ncbi:MAG: putative Fimbral protein [Candidatus Saccharibacteria bacterium]|jgi:prepilin-type N-terminal cleavage/methylation domain-containing protein|nr:putative Fimbral protein [Candidatus Saccharibacteria bacterium]
MNLVGKNKQPGFTIVELLIVIVVIGILAAITVVAYSGVQAKAQNASRLSEAEQVAKILTVYRVQNGEYPAFPSGSISVCVGEGFSDLNADGVADCWDANKTGTSNAHPNAAFNAALKTVATLPVGNRTPIASGTYLRLGPVFTLVGGVTYYVHYWLQGSSCPAGTMTWSDTLTVRCSIMLES